MNTLQECQCCRCWPYAARLLYPCLHGSCGPAYHVLRHPLARIAGMQSLQPLSSSSLFVSGCRITLTLDDSYSDIYSVTLWGQSVNSGQGYEFMQDHVDVILSTTANFTATGTYCKRNQNLIAGSASETTFGRPITVLCPLVANAAFLTLYRRSYGSPTTNVNEGMSIDEVYINRGEQELGRSQQHACTLASIHPLQHAMPGTDPLLQCSRSWQ